VKRLILFLLLAGWVAGETLGPAEPFSVATVKARAALLAAAPYEERRSRVPAALQSLDYDDFRRISYRRECAWWVGTGLPFQLQFAHPGFLLKRSIQVSEVSAGQVTPILSIPLSIALSQRTFGQAALRAKLFLTPEEAMPPYELRRLRQNLAECYQQLPPIEPLRADYGLLQAVLDPYINAVHVSLLRQRRPSEEARDWFVQLRTRLLAEGPSQLTEKEKLALLLDAESMIWLHEELWRLPGSAQAEWWRLAIRQYNVLTTAPATALYR
jgi:hypothetical protein